MRWDSSLTLTFIVSALLKEEAPSGVVFFSCEEPKSESLDIQLLLWTKRVKESSSLLHCAAILLETSYSCHFSKFIVCVCADVGECTIESPVLGIPWRHSVSSPVVTRVTNNIQGWNYRRWVNNSIISPFFSEGRCYFLRNLKRADPCLCVRVPWQLMPGQEMVHHSLAPCILESLCM